MRKSLMLLMVSLVLTLVVSACSGSSGNAGNSGNSESTGDTAGSTAGNGGDGSKGAQEITVWAWDPNFNIAALNLAKERYEAKHTDIKVNIVEYAQDDIVQKLNTGLNSGTTKGLPNIVLNRLPAHCTACGACASASAPETAARNAAETVSMRPYTAVSAARSVASPAAVATGFPDSVPAW